MAIDLARLSRCPLSPSARVGVREVARNHKLRRMHLPQHPAISRASGIFPEHCTPLPQSPPTPMTPMSAAMELDDHQGRRQYFNHLGRGDLVEKDTSKDKDSVMAVVPTIRPGCGRWAWESNSERGQRYAGRLMVWFSDSQNHMAAYASQDRKV